MAIVTGRERRRFLPPPKGRWVSTPQYADEIRAKRLRARPAWRKASEEFIATHKEFAQWQLDNATTSYDPPMLTVDTSHISVEEAGQQIAQWVVKTLDNRLIGTSSTFR